MILYTLLWHEFADIFHQILTRPQAANKNFPYHVRTSQVSLSSMTSLSLSSLNLWASSPPILYVQYKPILRYSSNSIVRYSSNLFNLFHLVLFTKMIVISRSDVWSRVLEQVPYQRWKTRQKHNNFFSLLALKNKNNQIFLKSKAKLCKLWIVNFFV